MSLYSPGSQYSFSLCSHYLNDPHLLWSLRSKHSRFSTFMCFHWNFSYASEKFNSILSETFAIKIFHYMFFHTLICESDLMGHFPVNIHVPLVISTVNLHKDVGIVIPSHFSIMVMIFYVFILTMVFHYMYLLLEEYYCTKFSF